MLSIESEAIQRRINITETIASMVVEFASMAIIAVVTIQRPMSNFVLRDTFIKRINSYEQPNANKTLTFSALCFSSSDNPQSY